MLQEAQRYIGFRQRSKSSAVLNSPLKQLLKRGVD